MIAKVLPLPFSCPPGERLNEPGQTAGNLAISAHHFSFPLQNFQINIKKCLIDML